MSDKHEMVNINVLIAERLYPLKVLKSDEDKVRVAVSMINEKLREYQQLYDGKDKQDYLAMSLLNFVVEHENLQLAHMRDSHILEEKLTELETVLGHVSE
ncbi:MAG TPA: cell division protein ZapA [Chitinophagales bacterium]|nr:cell division protein ZapA [Chitinophagales bacterium]